MLQNRSAVRSMARPELSHVCENDLAVAVTVEADAACSTLVAASFSLGGRLLHRVFVGPRGTDEATSGLAVHHVPEGEKARRGGDPGHDLAREEAQVLVDLRWVHADPGDHERRADRRR